VHLVQVFDDTYWLQVPPITPAPTRVFHDGFETDDLAKWKSKQKPRTTLSRVQEGVSGGWALQQSAGKGTAALPALKHRVNVQGDKTYRFSVQVQTEDLGAPGRSSEGATIGLIERTRDGIVLRHETLPRLRGDTPWRTLSTTFHTSPDTRELDLRLVPATGMTGGRVLYDNVTLDLLDPQAELGRLPIWTEYARPDPHPHVRGVTLGPDFRPAIVHAIPASWGFDIQVPPQGATLRFAWAVGAGTRTGDPVCFSVQWADRHVGAGIWNRCSRDNQGQSWTDVSLPLTASGTLVFTAQGTLPDPMGQALWADVRVVAPPTEPLPNVALIVLDTLRPDHLGAYGHTDRPSSPALDAFAERAIRYTDVRALSPWTAPSLGTLVTGRYASEHRAGTRVLREIEITKANAGQTRKNQLNYTGMSLDHPVLAEFFAASGYETVGIQTNYFYGPALGFARGLGRNIQFKGSSLQGAQAGLDLMRDWLKARDDEQPFFLSAHFIDPHLPYRMRRPWVDGFAPPEDLADVDHNPTRPALVLRNFTDENRTQPEAIEILYDADIRWLDDALGELLPLLEQRNTLIVVVSDHGEAFGEHGKFNHGWGLYDELLRVPLLVQLPGAARGGTVDTRRASLLDVFPTLLKQLGATAPEGLPGRDLLASAAESPEPLVLEAMYSGRDRTGLVDGDWKYIYTHPNGYLGFHRAGVKTSTKSHKAIEELFDLANDPGEQRDLGSEQPKQLAAMRDQVHDWLQRTWPGVHLRCQGVSDTIEWQTSESIGQISPFWMGPAATLQMDRTRHRVSLDFGEEPGWVVLRFLEPGATISLSGPAITAGGVLGTRWTLGSSDLPDGPPPSFGPGCQIWEVPLSESRGQDVDQETFEELEALGYVE
jgi:arylsulfatase A-like enzyme